MTAPLFPPRPRLRLEASAPRPRRIEVRINATEARYPYGRSRAFHLTHDELDELIDVAMRIEGRRS
jgi:hypothetical protein